MATYWSDMANSPTCVYRCYDELGDLLYVGLTRNTLGRFSKHAHQKPWWPEVEHIELEWFETRDEAFAAEKRAIAAEDPAFNISRPRVGGE